MEYQIRISDDDAFNWLRTLLENTISSDTNAAIIAYPHLKAWIDAFDESEYRQKNAKEYKKIDKPLAKSTDKPKVKAKKKTAAKTPSTDDKIPKGKLDSSGLSCTIHKTYEGKRVPRKDCPGCWAVYKKFHPMEYSSKRRTFLTKQRSNSQ